MKKLGFCFLIYDKINNEELWYNWFKNVDNEKYNIYIHYKENVVLKYFNNYKLKNCIETKYSDVSVINAHNLLFKKAYNDDCYKIISLSQACIPLKSFNHVYSFLTNNDKGYFTLSLNQAGVFPRCNSVINYYGGKNVFKSSNWFILNRNISKNIIFNNPDSIIKIWKDVSCPEEHYFITEIFKNNLESEIITKTNLPTSTTTFANWKNMNYPFPTSSSRKRPKNYDSINFDEIQYLLNESCLFGRKFDVNCKLECSLTQYLSNQIC